MRRAVLVLQRGATVLKRQTCAFSGDKVIIPTPPSMRLHRGAKWVARLLLECAWMESAYACGRRAGGGTLWFVRCIAALPVDNCTATSTMTESCARAMPTPCPASFSGLVPHAQ